MEMVDPWNQRGMSNLLNMKVLFIEYSLTFVDDSMYF